ncbi:hypothetical protein Leryth_003427 [Lithospermum erythrorhizon]|nr:hypothetical protein Leryth_003427 [Lithospermum erythrorhizon]
MAASEDQPRGQQPLEGSLRSTNKKKFKLTNTIQEGEHSIYGIIFNFIDAKYFDVFASVGGNYVNIYQCMKDGGIGLLQHYFDEDKDECFYTTSWSCSHEGTPILVVGGLKGILHVIDVRNMKIIKSLIGHGGPINEVKTQPLKPSIALTASKDESIRLWNIQTGICIMKFAGEGGHRLDALSVDFHPSDIYKFLSCGMDSTVKVWSIKMTWSHVEESFIWTDLPSKFPTLAIELPMFTVAVHVNYVDCNRWIGNFIMSKGGDNEIVLWEPKLEGATPLEEGSLDILHKYPVPDSNHWFMKFSLDFKFKTMAIGNRKGRVYVWDLLSSPPELISKLSTSNLNSTIRQTALSFNGSTILCCCDDGSIWRWDQVAAS